MFNGLTHFNGAMKMKEVLIPKSILVFQTNLKNAYVKFKNFEY